MEHVGCIDIRTQLFHFYCVTKRLWFG